MHRLLHAAVAATVACAVYAAGATLFAAPAEARSARGTDGILYQPYLNNRVVFEGTGEVDNVYTSNRGTDIDPDTPGTQVRGIMYSTTGCFARRRPGTLAVTARIVSGDRGAVGVVVRTNGALQCVYAWAKTDADRDNDSVRVTATAVLTNNGTEVDRFEDTFTVEQRDMISGVGEGAPLGLTAPPPRTFTAGAAINVPALPAAGGGSGHYIYALTGRGGAARPSWIRFDSTGRRMSGTPPTAAAVTLDYTVDDGNASVTRSFTVTVNAALSLSAPANRTYTAGKAIQAFTLSPATGGTAPLRYELSGLPGGLEFFGSTRRVTGTPLAATATPATVTCKVTDANGATDTETFTVTVLAVLAVDAPLDMALREGQALRETILPAATGGDGNYNYEIAPALPAGLEFDSGTRMLSGTPESGQARTRYSYSVGDGAGNFAEATFTIAVATGADTTAPTVRSVERHDGTNAQREHTNADTLTFRVTFNEDVRNVDTEDFDASGTSGAGASLVTAVPGSPTQYIVTVGGGTKGGTLASHDGEVGLTFASDQDIADWSGNALTATTPTGADETYTLDNTAPTVTVIRAGRFYLLNTAFNVTVTFTEANGLQTSGPGAFTAADLAVTNGDATAVTATADPLVWTARIAPDASLSDNVLVDLPANRVRDRAGNGNVAATQLSVWVDNIVPTPVLSASPATHDGSSTSVVTIDFGEPMAGFRVADIGVSGGSASGFTGTIGSSIYTVTVTPNGFTDVVVSVAAGVAWDDGGNGNLAADDLVVPAFFSWTATLTVSAGSEGDSLGYCTVRCTGQIADDTKGSLVDDGGDNAFSAPGTAGVAVTMLVYQVQGELQGGTLSASDLYLRLTPLPPQSVYAQWTLNVGGHEAGLSGAVVVQNNSSLLRFNDFYPAGTGAPGAGATVTVCIRAGSGSCSGTSGTSGTSGATAARAAAEPIPALTARVGGVTVSAAELSVPEGGRASYTVVLDGQPAANVTVSAAKAAGGDADLTVRPASRTFTRSNWDTPQTFTVSAAREPRSSGFDINPGFDSIDGTASFTHTVTSTDTVYDGMDVASLEATEDDQDEHQVVWEYPSRNSGNPHLSTCLAEGRTTNAYRARLSAPPSAGMGVVASFRDKFSGPGGKIVPVNAAGTVIESLAFTADNWNVVQSFHFSMPEDDDAEDQETVFEFVTASGDPGWNELVGDDGGIEICALDDDRRGWTVTRTATSVTEGRSVRYTVEPDTRPVGKVDVGLTLVTDNAEATLDRTALRFSFDDWAAKTVTVTTSADDNAADGTVTVRHECHVPALPTGTTPGDPLATEYDQAYCAGAYTRDLRDAVFSETDATAATTVALALPAVANQSWTARRARYADPLPQAEGAGGTVAYALAGKSDAALPSWLEFSAEIRVMMGTPPAAAAPVTLVYSATDDNETPADTSDDVTATATFTITVNPAPTLAGVSDQTWTAGTAVATLELPAATGGTAPLTYTLEAPSKSALPSWMTFDGTADPPTITGTPDAVAPAVTLTYTATDANGAKAEVEFDVTVVEAAPGGTEAPESGLATRFGALPDWHAGMAFWTELHFSEAPNLGYKDVRDKALEVTGGRLLRARRLEQNSNRSWRLEVLPVGFDDITLTLPATEDCAAEGAVCTADGERLEEPLSVTVPGPGERLAAKLTGFSTRHAGEPFEPELWFNHAPNISYRDVRDTLFEATGGRIARAKRQQQGSNLRWNLVVEPEAVGDLTLTLPATEDCAAPRAVCTQDGRKLARGLSVRIEGPAAFSVSDAQVDEGSKAVLAFEVSLSRRLRAEARVDVATRDGTATAGADYEAVTQTLVFARGETVKTVEVAVLDDAHDEGEETMTLVLSNATGAPIADAEGTGTIVNTDAIPKAWIARFGRTVTGQVLDAVEGRLAAPRQAGMRATLAGYALVAPDGTGTSAVTGGVAETPAQATAGDHASVAALGGWTNGTRTGRSQALRERGMGGPEPQSLDITSHALVTGTAFTLSAGSAEDRGHGSLWGHASVAGFDGREDALSLDGEVTTGFLGADWAAERWTVGLALGHSVGTGGYRNRGCAGSAPADGAQGRGCGGRIEAALTGLYPYAGVDLNDRVSVWLAGGHGAGALTVVPDGQGAIETDLAMGMGAAGTRIAVLEPEGGAGVNLALVGDGRFTRTSSDAARAPGGDNLDEAEADVWLLRFGVEGSRRFALAGAGVAGPGAGDASEASLTPSFEVGVRRDGGDAETGFGADMGGGVAFAAPQRGLRFDLKGRALVMHEASGFREWGASAAFGFDPRPATERGLALSLTQSWGASPSGGMDALLGGEALSGPVANDDAGTGFTAPSRLSGELGYGLPAFGGGFTGTPNLGFGLSSDGARDWRLGWRLTPALRGGSRFEVSLDATRREGAGEPAEHGAMLTGTFRW